MPVVTVEIQSQVAVVTIENPPVNATSTAVRQGLLDAVASVQGCRLAVLKCTGRTFVAGGDMSEFDRPAEEPHLPDVVQAIENSETPFLALLHGTVLGGGLEIAMGCAFRIATHGTRFGLPEVNMGLVPGAGGTQRAPRLFGWEASIDMACSAKLLDAETALSLGAIDAISDDAFNTALAWNQSPPQPVSQRIAPAIEAEWFQEKRRTLVTRARGQKAPVLNFDALQWALNPFPESQPRERKLHLKLRQSEESKALRHAFFAERQVAKPNTIQGGTAADIAHVAVVGGGLMGAGIATTFLFAGCSVCLIEQNEDAARAGNDRVLSLLEGARKRGKINNETFSEFSSKLTATANYSDAADVDLAIEAVFEDLTVKQQVFEELAAVVGDRALLATNTSYLDPREIFEGIANSERLIGLHFFSPAHIMKLLEVVRLPTTSANTLATAFALAKRLKKVAVLSGICDGFIGNRMLAAYRREAEYLLADGATPTQIDAAMRAFGMAMGPFEAQDMSGLQIAEANRRRQDATRDINERHVTISDRLCGAGRFGQRSGKGWYDYPDGPKSKTESQTVLDVIKSYAQDQGIERREFSTQDIQNQLLAVLANEGAQIVEEGIAENDAAVDMVKVQGYGFPRWTGGPMHHADRTGTQHIAAALRSVSSRSPGSWKIAKRYQT
ncbi:3-hydroxyacyl-CoA dehydrogenase [Tateyamaria omphalii]|uniref:3-hydroxyacyl-CoA dehydrogenase NAD-binding domain-containing protein n=1 Tax=Tateyamaria omphalii TaxID=299262 RepID=UPI0016741DEA|nr:3-hydroxyacyl-CoA dehydrogenase NAD-binding domain-containing protein [Tateyamaria omphalii]GGX68527.1 3-hydroxyacyl-CoA dehydrogenase [Tateyamaria omphalii]